MSVARTIGTPGWSSVSPVSVSTPPKPGSPKWRSFRVAKLATCAARGAGSVVTLPGKNRSGRAGSPPGVSIATRWVLPGGEPLDAHLTRAGGALGDRAQLAVDLAPGRERRPARRRPRR